MVKQNIKQLLIGTNNSGKLTEIRDLLPKYIKTFSTLDFKLKSPKENGKTFEQNSLIKSKYFSKRSSFSMLQTMKNGHARTLFHFKLQTLSHLISKTSKRPGGLCSNLRGSATKSVLAV